MDRLRELWARMRAQRQRGAGERELEEELRFHIDMETQAGIARGLSQLEARREALVKFGGVDRYTEEARDERRLPWLEEARHDARYTLRMLAKSPVFSAAAVLTLALGIGANTAIFSVVDAVLLADSPFPEPDRLVMVWETDRSSDTFHEPASWPDVVDFRERSRALAGIGVVVGQDLTVTADGEPERVTGLAVTTDLLPLLGVRPVAGRLFAADEGVSAAVVMLGEEYWRARYDADPAVVGRTLLLNEQRVTVVGIAPAEADLGIRQVHERADYGGAFSGARVDVWRAIQPTEAQFPRTTHPFLTLGRLENGVSLEAAQTELAAIAADIEEAFPENAARGVNLELYSEVVFGPVRPALMVLLGAVGLVLLVTCANVANLLLARTASRLRDVAVRLALGAGPGRVRRQFLVEAGVLTALGTLAGIALAFVGLRTLVALAPADIPRLDQASVSGAVLGWTGVVGAVVALAFGMLPVLQLRRLDVHETLKTQPGRRTSEGRRGRRFRAALVVAEVALSVLLVVGAGLMLRSFWALRSVDPGFETERIVKAEYQLPGSRYPRDLSRWPDIPEITNFHNGFLDAVQAIPGVEAAAVAGSHPLDAGFTNSFVIVGREAESADFPEMRTRFITPGYLETLGVPLLEGRNLSAGDGPTAPAVILINKAAAERYFPDGNAIGQEIRYWGANRRIVGVIGDEKFRGIDAPTDPATYSAYAQSPMQVGVLLVRGTGDPMGLVPAIRQAFRALDPQLALYSVEPLAATLTNSIAKPRFTATLLGLFAAVAVLLAIVGVHGVMSYTVAQRTPEVGIRMALGASRTDVLRSVVGEGLVLATVGVAIGLTAALIASRVFASLVFGVTTTDPVTYGVVTAAVLVSATMAGLLPALRATRVDPAHSLRAE